MFTLDERLKGLPALRDQVVSVYESLNQPHLAIPGRRPGLSKAYVLGLRSQQGYAAFVYLWMFQSNECAVYVPSSRVQTQGEYQGEEAGALGFVESMGFMMDDLFWSTRPVAEQDELVKTLAPFQRDPSAAKKAGPTVDAKAEAVAAAATTAANLGKLFGAFALALFVACAHVPTEKERIEAQAYYDLAANMAQKEPQGALMELEKALKLDPDMPEANNAKGVLLHVVFGRPEEAIGSYKHALEVRPAFSEAKVNLGNVYLDQKRYEDAITLYREVLNDMLYGTPFLAQGNLGWALYKKGDTKEAITSIKSAVTMNPKFCLGYRNLGTIYDETGSLDDACKAFGKFRELCPDVADAYLREGVCLAKKGDVAGAQKSFDGCVEKSQRDDEKESCKKLKQGLPAPPQGG